MSLLCLLVSAACLVYTTAVPMEESCFRQDNEPSYLRSHYLQKYYGYTRYRVHSDGVIFKTSKSDDIIQISLYCNSIGTYNSSSSFIRVNDGLGSDAPLLQVFRLKGAHKVNSTGRNLYLHYNVQATDTVFQVSCRSMKKPKPVPQDSHNGAIIGGTVVVAVVVAAVVGCTVWCRKQKKQACFPRNVPPSRQGSVIRLHVCNTLTPTPTPSTSTDSSHTNRHTGANNQPSMVTRPVDDHTPMNDKGRANAEKCSEVGLSPSTHAVSQPRDIISTDPPSYYEDPPPPYPGVI